jgi:uncharacterized protein
MASDYESFWNFERYAVVGHTAKRPFPRLTYGALKKNKKTVYAVDPSTNTIDQDPAYIDFVAMPGPVEAAVLELPKDETATWVEKAANAGIKNIWLHMNTDTSEALAIAKERGIQVRKGTCAVMYLKKGFTYHAIHAGIMKLMKKY